MPPKSKAKRKAPPSQTVKGARTGSTRLPSASARLRPDRPARQVPNRGKPNSGCPIVGIGGSARGFSGPLGIIRELFPHNRIAVVIVPHLHTPPPPPVSP